MLTMAPLIDLGAIKEWEVHFQSGPTKLEYNPHSGIDPQG